MSRRRGHPRQLRQLVTGIHARRFASALQHGMPILHYAAQRAADEGRHNLALIHGNATALPFVSRFSMTDR